MKVIFNSTSNEFETLNLMMLWPFIFGLRVRKEKDFHKRNFFVTFLLMLNMALINTDKIETIVRHNRFSEQQCASLKNRF